MTGRQLIYWVAAGIGALAIAGVFITRNLTGLIPLLPTLAVTPKVLYRLYIEYTLRRQMKAWLHE